MSDEEAESNSVSPVLKADWFNSCWGREGQRGNGNLMTRDKVLEVVKLIKTGEIVSLGMPYDAQMPIAPGRAYALRMPGGPTGGPYGDKSKTIWNDEFIATEIGQIGTQMDALGHLGCMCGMRGDKTNMLFYNGNRLSEMWSPYGLKKLGIENARPFFTRGVLFDGQGVKGRSSTSARRSRSPTSRRASNAKVSTNRRSHRATWSSCAPAMERAGIQKPAPSMMARRASASNARAGSRALRSASSGLIISPSRSCPCRSRDFSSLPPAPHHGERNKSP